MGCGWSSPVTRRGELGEASVLLGGGGKRGREREHPPLKDLPVNFLNPNSQGDGIQKQAFAGDYSALLEAPPSPPPPHQPL